MTKRQQRRHRDKNDAAMPKPTPTVAADQQEEANNENSQRGNQLNNLKSSKWGVDTRIQFSVLIAAVIVGVFNILLWMVTKDGIYRGQRAYLVASEFQFQDAPEAKKQLRANVMIKNTGQTPAINVSINAKLYVHQPGDRIEPPEQMVRTAGIGTLGSDQLLASEVVRSVDSTFTKDWPLTETEYFAIFSQKIRPDIPPALVIRIAGRITYEDIFGYTNETDFCSEFLAGPVQFSSCPFFNTIRTVDDGWWQQLWPK